MPFRINVNMAFDVREFVEIKEHLQKFDRNGRIYIPKKIRDQFKDQVFFISVVDGKIVLDPIKIE